MSYCYYLRGEFFIRNSPFECPPIKEVCNPKIGTYRKIGNTSSCQLTINSQIIGNENQFHRVSPKNRLAVTGVNLNLQIECSNKENLLMAFNGDKREINNESYSEKIQYCGKDSISFLTMPPQNLVLIALDTYGDEIYTLIEDIDYLLDGSKVTFLNVPEETRTIWATYESDQEVNSFDLKNFNSKYHEIFFNGHNIEDKRKVELKIWRVIFAPITDSDFISKDNFFTLPLQGIVEKSNQGYARLTFFGENDGTNESTIY